MKTGRLIVLDRSGHSTLEYNRADPADVARADAVLADALAQGRLAYRAATWTSPSPTTITISISPRV